MDYSRVMRLNGASPTWGATMKARVRKDWETSCIDYDSLYQRLLVVKKEFGMRRAVSSRSLTGETRTFAEILDSEVEKVVLFYLKVQGELAAKLWEMRAKQLAKLQYFVSLEQIENLCQKYRELGMEVLQLLEYLDLNVIALRKILRKHDRQFDLRMSNVYFDTRLGSSIDGSGTNAVNGNSQLVQLYHQEGLRAIIGTIRRGFEDLYEAKEALLATMENNKGKNVINTSRGGAMLIGGLGGGAHKPSLYSHADDPQDLRSHIPRIPYLNRINSSAALSSAIGPSREGLKSSMRNASTNWLDRMATSSEAYSPHSSTSSYTNPLTLMPFFSSRVSPRSEGITRSISDLEPLLSQITDSANKVMNSQKRTISEYFASHSAMALELRVRDMARENEDEEEDYWDQESVRETSNIGLSLMLFATFLYQANQYVIGPTSGLYASMLGESEAMSGLIIGLSPMAALISAVVFSFWTNYSFKSPLLVSLVFLAVGNLLYASALQYQSVPMMFMGRLLSGLGAPRGIARRYIADYVSLTHRTLASSHFVTASAMGLAIGPLISSSTSSPSNSFVWKYGNIVLVQYEIVTAPGWIMCLLFSISVLAVMLLFEEPHKHSNESIQPKTKRSSSLYAPISCTIEPNFSPRDVELGSGFGYSDSLNQLRSKVKTKKTTSLSHASNYHNSNSKSNNIKDKAFSSSESNSTDSLFASPRAQSLGSSYGSMDTEKMQEHVVSVEIDVMGLEEGEGVGGGGDVGRDAKERRLNKGHASNTSNDNIDVASNAISRSSSIQSNDRDATTASPSITTTTAGLDSKMSSVSSFSITASSNNSSLHSLRSMPSSSFHSIASPSFSAFTSYQNQQPNTYNDRPMGEGTNTTRYIPSNLPATKNDTSSGIANTLEIGYHPPHHYHHAAASIVHRIVPKQTLASLFSLFGNITAEVAVILMIYVVNKTGQEIVVSSVPTLWVGVGGGGLRESGYFMAGECIILSSPLLFILYHATFTYPLLSLSPMSITHYLLISLSLYHYHLSNILVMGLLVLPANLIISKLTKESEDRSVMQVSTDICHVKYMYVCVYIHYIYLYIIYILYLHNCIYICL